MQNVIELLQKLVTEADVAKKEKLFDQVKQYIDHLLLHDFDKLVTILYRVDVDEDRLKELLKKEPQQDAAYIIVNLLIERQQQKMNFKRTGDTGSIPDNEKW